MPFTESGFDNKHFSTTQDTVQYTGSTGIALFTQCRGQDTVFSNH